jgi:hypothetical protein
LKIPNTKQRLPSKCEVLSSNPTLQKKKKEEERERESERERERRRIMAGHGSSYC